MILETCFRTDHFNPSDISLFLGNTSLYLIGAGPIIKNGQTIDAPAQILFRAKQFNEGKQHLLAALCGFIHWIAQLST